MASCTRQPVLCKHGASVLIYKRVTCLGSALQYWSGNHVYVHTHFNISHRATFPELWWQAACSLTATQKIDTNAIVRKYIIFSKQHTWGTGNSVAQVITKLHTCVYYNMYEGVHLAVGMLYYWQQLLQCRQLLPCEARNDAILRLQ